jgi:hypothetical protein
MCQSSTRSKMSTIRPSAQYQFDSVVADLQIGRYNGKSAGPVESSGAQRRASKASATFQIVENVGAPTFLIFCHVF